MLTNKGPVTPDTEVSRCFQTVESMAPGAPKSQANMSHLLTDQF